MRILVVEDETGIANFIRDGLREESFAVDVASNGKEGLHLALSNEYDLLLLDWMVPGLSGIEICRQFRKENSTTPIIFLTAKDTVDETIFALESGANDYIKTICIRRAFSKIRVQLRQKPQITFCLSIRNRTNPISHLLLKTQTVSLTQKEFALLEYFFPIRKSLQ